jgi:hypothetical protein
MLCLSGCGSDEVKPAPKDAAADTGKKDSAANPDVVDAPPQQPDAAPDVKTPDAPVSPDSPRQPDAPAPDAPQSPETGRPDVAGLDTAPLDTASADMVRLDAVAIEAKPVDTSTVDSGISEAGQSEAGAPLPALFTTSPCKKSASANISTPPGVGLSVIDNQTGLDGLACVGWARGSTDAQIDLFNYAGSCGASWTGNGAVAADGSVKLTVDNPSCSLASCGTCMYDWSFTLRSPIPANQSVPLSIQVNPCPDRAGTTTTATIGATKSGLRCTFANYGALGWHASAKDLCGKAGMPCKGTDLCRGGGSSTTLTCDTGLVCDSTVTRNEARCLIPCQTYADCPRTDVWTCSDGLCVPQK